MMMTSQDYTEQHSMPPWNDPFGGGLKMNPYCPVCGKEIEENHPRFITKSGEQICMDCEGAEIVVYKISPIDSLEYYYDIDPRAVVELVKEALEGKGYTITRERMKALEYYNLKEFDGF